MQLEPEEPAHGALPPLGNALERLVDVDSLISAYPERSAVYEADARGPKCLANPEDYTVRIKRRMKNKE